MLYPILLDTLHPAKAMNDERDRVRQQNENVEKDEEKGKFHGGSSFGNRGYFIYAISMFMFP